MTATELLDGEDRRRIREDLDAALFVEAGAGTGKTSELVQRVLALVDSGVEIRNIAAITFTEAAAAELRDRVRVALEGWSKDGDEARRERATYALEHLDGAALETLHAFSGRLLGMYPLEAGIPPRFQVIDEVGYAIQAGHEWDDVHARMQKEPGLETAITYALALGVRLESARNSYSLRGVFDRFCDNWDRLPPEPFAGEPFSEPDTRHLVALMDKAIALRPQCSDDDDRLATFLDDLVEIRRRVAHATIPVQRARALNSYVRQPQRRNQGRKENWTDKALVAAAIREMHEERERLLEQLGASLLPPLLEFLRKAALAFAVRRRAEGLLAFQDLLVLARDLLRDHPAVRDELCGRFTRLLIDEFQDTDPLQADIAALLATPADGMPIAPGRLFFVGDAKQSIYRFRRADIEMYQDSRTRFGCEPVGLASNFRSSSAVIDWCNHVFAQLLGEERPGQAGHQQLHAAREGLDGGSVHLLGGPREGMLAAELDEAEASSIAEATARVITEKWQVQDRDGSRRPARFDDIAVLLRTRKFLRQLERNFEALDVPYRVESRSLVFETQGVRDILSILAAIDDPTDEVAVVAALRSPAFACGDDDLLRHFEGGGRWDYVTDQYRQSRGVGPVRDAFDYLHGLHERRAWIPLGELVDRVIRERGLREIAFAHRRPREHWQRYRFLLEQVRALEANEGATLHDLVSWLRRQASGYSLVNETVTPEEDDDAVRVMTVHASKGLEFPIVIMAGFGGDRNDRDMLVWPRDGGPPQVRLGNAQTSGYVEANAAESELETYERARLVYVAATRARDHLVVSTFHSPSSRGDGSEAQQLLRICADAPGLWSPFPPGASTVRLVPPASPPARDLPPFETWRRDRDALLRAQARTQAIAATVVAGTGDSGPETADDEGSQVFRRGRAATSVGRAVHAVLQSVDLESGSDVAVLSAAAAAAEGIPARTAEIERLVRALIASDVVQEAVAGNRYWREVFVSAPVGEILVEGYIDLLYEGPRGLVVVDYKTDSVEDDESIVAATERYRLQGAAYALALERTLGRPVADCKFLFARMENAPSAAITNLREAIAEVERVVTAARA